ncbi:MAG: hypothetical protein V4532_05285, partial [Pseudomonadota bacterium]
MQVRGIFANGVIVTVLGVGGLILWQRVFVSSDSATLKGQSGGPQSWSLLAAGKDAINDRVAPAG